MAYCNALTRLGSSPSFKGLKITMYTSGEIWEKSKERRTWDSCKRAKIYTIGFFLRRRGLQVDNNKLSRQFLQVTFEMLQMSQVRLSLLFSWGGLEPSLCFNRRENFNQRVYYRTYICMFHFNTFDFSVAA
jgi:hypothetical protein